MFPCALPVPSILDSYHGTLHSSFQLSAVSFQLLGESSSAFDLNLGPGTPLQLCRELRQVFRSQTLQGPCGDSRLGCPARAKLGRPPKSFPPPAISRCGPADYDRFPIQLPLPASWLAPESACPSSRPRERHPSRCD